MLLNSKMRARIYCHVKDNPFFTKGCTLRGHEFHYSGIIRGKDEVDTAFSLNRGTGCFDKRDGITYKNVLASYTHLHAGTSEEWAEGIINAARKFNQSK